MIKRREILQACAEIVRSNAQILAELITLEQGKTLSKALNEVMGSAAWFAYTSELQLPTRVIKDDENTRVEVHHRPLGVVGAIIPWNYPVMTAVWKIAPALMAGNTVVLKPSPYTPLATLKLAELLRDVIPVGVLNVISGGDDLGRNISSHPGIQKITFTGSTSAGKQVATAAAIDLKRIMLELGGNDAAVVMPDVDIETTAEKIFNACFDNCGQICVAIKRIYVHASVFEEFSEQMRRLAAKAIVGNGTDQNTTIGPLNNLAQLNRVIELAESAKETGGTFLCGGERLKRKGYFFPPTLVRDLPWGSRLVEEEQFGPIVPLLAFEEVSKVIDHVNSSQFGLAGSVWSSDVETASAIAAQLEIGTVWINQHLAIIPPAPIAGRKWSGMGVENGQYGFESYTAIQTLSIAKN